MSFVNIQNDITYDANTPTNNNLVYFKTMKVIILYVSVYFFEWNFLSVIIEMHTNK